MKKGLVSAWRKAEAKAVSKGHMAPAVGNGRG